MHLCQIDGGRWSQSPGAEGRKDDVKRPQEPLEVRPGRPLDLKANLCTVWTEDMLIKREGSWKLN